MKRHPARGLPSRIVIPIVLCVAVIAAIPIALFLKTGFGTAGSSIAPAEITTPPPAIAQALTELRSRIARNPHDVEALTALAGLYAQIGKLDEAATLEGQAVEAAPHDLSLRAAYATLLRGAKHNKEALVQIDAILAEKPHDADALFDRVSVDADLHDHAAFVRDMQLFSQYAPKGDPRLGIAHAALGTNTK
jgi:cytochrome c-type biogenesis protein CcmH/NrfG